MKLENHNNYIYTELLFAVTVHFIANLAYLYGCHALMFLHVNLPTQWKANGTHEVLGI
jgi:hypothetical protein